MAANILPADPPPPPPHTHLPGDGVNRPKSIFTELCHVAYQI